MALDSNPILRIVRLTFKKEHVNDFKLLFEKIRPQIESFEGCLELQIFRDNELENVFYTLSRWLSATHLEKYRNSDLFKTTWENVSRWFDDKPKGFTLVALSGLLEEKV